MILSSRLPITEDYPSIGLVICPSTDAQILGGCVNRASMLIHSIEPIATRVIFATRAMEESSSLLGLDLLEQIWAELDLQKSSRHDKSL